MSSARLISSNVFSIARIGEQLSLPRHAFKIKKFQSQQRSAAESDQHPSPAASFLLLRLGRGHPSRRRNQRAIEAIQPQDSHQSIAPPTNVHCLSGVPLPHPRLNRPLVHA
ncbi:hypothetical protein CDAR_309931 [Caerostris darwini]|uniref:Uncharacterized protein n=1 Tax=Caerostris darwini TaxID=1538125 RepID=A0AAV4VWX2_9ARAC|nr:hypothetical protein CDAR_309931 [Caerostris darwini]